MLKYIHAKVAMEGSDVGKHTLLVWLMHVPRRWGTWQCKSLMENRYFINAKTFLPYIKLLKQVNFNHCSEIFTVFTLCRLSYYLILCVASNR